MAHIVGFKGGMVGRAQSDAVADLYKRQRSFALQNRS